MLQLYDVLYAVQERWSRRRSQLPPHWHEAQLNEVVTDSREVGPGDLFLALSGERTDGHLFLADVIARGAGGALVSRTAAEAQAANLSGLTRPWVIVDPASDAELAAVPANACLLIAVDDPLMAVQRLAVYHRSLYTPTVVGITGSVGKTSTKEVTAAVLASRFRTLKSKRSFNSEATLPTSLLRIRPDHEVVVLEMGMWAPGEIRFLADLARPQVGIVTNVGPSHLERMGSLTAISNAKAELPEALPETGWCLLNADDPYVAAMAERTRAQVLRFGLGPQAELRASDLQSFGLEGIACRLHHADTSLDLRLPLPGRHSIYTALAAAAAGLVLGLTWPEIVAGLQHAVLTERVQTLPGLSGATLIDDSYNAAPISTLAALDLLGDLPGRKLAVLGDMLELGAAEDEGHRAVGRRAAEVSDWLITVGPRARLTAKAAREAGMHAACVLACADTDEASRIVRPLLGPGDYVLIKGSRGMEMERIVAALRQRPEEK